MLQPDQKYQGKVERGQMIRSKNKGTTGFEVLIAVPEQGDSIFHTIWITAGGRERAGRDLISLGADPEAFSQKADESEAAFRQRLATYLNGPLAEDVAGKTITFGTKAEEYQGKLYTKVKWLGERKASGEPAASKEIADAASILAGFEPFSASTENSEDEIPW
jgi:hypothetical protein